MQTADVPTLPAEPGRPSNRSALMIVFLVVFIDLLGFGIILPLLPRIAESYVKRVIPNATWQIGLIVGLLMSSFSLMQFLFAPIWGRLSDRIGRRPILLIGLLGSVVFYSLFGYAASLAPEHAAALALVLFFVTRIGAGVAGATIATAQAVIADSTPPEKRKHGMALIGAAFGIGFTFGPLIGFGCLWISNNNLPAIGYTAAGLSAVAWLLGLGLMPETRVFSHDSTTRRHLLDPSAIRHALADPAIGPVVLTFFMASLGFGAFEVTLALFLKDTFGYGENDSFLIFAYIGFVLMLTQGGLYRRLASRVSETTFIGLGIFFMMLGVALQGGINYSAALAYEHEVLPGIAASTVGLMAIPLDQGPYLAAPALFAPRHQGGWHLPALFAALTSAVVGFAFLTPSAQALISRRSSADRQGEILGVNQSASALARILGPVFGVTLYMSTPTHILPYIAGAILLLLMFPMLPTIRRGGAS
jgi:DHA1 family tetracycline resistance protein-like MFS transporter